MQMPLIPKQILQIMNFNDEWSISLNLDGDRRYLDESPCTSAERSADIGGSSRRRSTRRSPRRGRTSRPSSAKAPTPRGPRTAAGGCLRGISKILANIWQHLNFAIFWRARSRLCQNEILQENMRLTAFFKLYKICILLHRCNLKILEKNGFPKKKQFL